MAWVELDVKILNISQPVLFFLKKRVGLFQTRKELDFPSLKFERLCDYSLSLNRSHVEEIPSA